MPCHPHRASVPRRQHLGAVPKEPQLTSTLTVVPPAEAPGDRTPGTALRFVRIAASRDSPLLQARRRNESREKQNRKAPPNTHLSWHNRCTPNQIPPQSSSSRDRLRSLYFFQLCWSAAQSRPLHLRVQAQSLVRLSSHVASLGSQGPGSKASISTDKSPAVLAFPLAPGTGKPKSGAYPKTCRSLRTEGAGVAFPQGGDPELKSKDGFVPMAETLRRRKETAETRQSVVAIGSGKKRLAQW